MVLVKLDQRGFAVSTGSACSSGQEKPSHVMEAMGLTPNEAGRVMRFSAGWETTPTDWEGLHQALMAVYQAAQRADVTHLRKPDEALDPWVDVSAPLESAAVASSRDRIGGGQ